MANTVLDEDFVFDSSKLSAREVSQLNSLIRPINSCVEEIKGYRKWMMGIMICYLLFSGYVSYTSPQEVFKVMLELIAVVLLYQVAFFHLSVNPLQRILLIYIAYFGLWCLAIVYDASFFYRGILLRMVLIYVLSKVLVAVTDIHYAIKHLKKIGFPNTKLQAMKKMEKIELL
ncbi:MAG: hypothetical protein AAF242_12835 [Bacteroidota bacterium]